MTRYVVWRPDYGQTREDGREFEASCPQYAVQEWAQREDCDGADYLIVSGRDTPEVLVAEACSSLPPLRYSVSGESVPSYRATMLHGKAARSKT